MASMKSTPIRHRRRCSRRLRRRRQAHVDVPLDPRSRLSLGERHQRRRKAGELPRHVTRVWRCRSVSASPSAPGRSRLLQYRRFNPICAKLSSNRLTRRRRSSERDPGPHPFCKEYFGFGDNWFGQFGHAWIPLDAVGPRAAVAPGLPEGQQRISRQGAGQPSAVILSLIGRKPFDLFAEYPRSPLPASR